MAQASCELNHGHFAVTCKINVDNVGQSPGNKTGIPSEVVCIQFIAKKYFEGQRLRIIPAIVRYFVKLPHCSCYTAIIMVASLAGVRTLHPRTAFTGSFNRMVRHPRCVFVNYNWINQLSKTAIWWLDICCLLHRYQLHVSALMAIFRLID